MRMQFEHLRLSLRRLAHSSAKHQLLAVTVWLVLIAVRLSFADWLIQHVDWRVDYIIIAIGQFHVTWLIASQIMSVATDSEGNQPDWYATPQSSTAIVLSHTLSTLLQIIGPVAGLYAYMALYRIQTWQGGSGYMDIIFLYSWIANSHLSLVRIPLTVLAFACILLAFRRSRILPYMPVLLALTSMLTSKWGPDWVAFSTSSWDVYQEIALSLSCWTAALVFIGLVVLLARLATRTAWGVAQSMIVLLAIILPMVFGVGSAVFVYSGWSRDVSFVNSWQAMPYHAGVSRIYCWNDVVTTAVLDDPAVIPDENWTVSKGVVYTIYEMTFMPGDAFRRFLFEALFAYVLWFGGVVWCLNTARRC